MSDDAAEGSQQVEGARQRWRIDLLEVPMGLEEISLLSEAVTPQESQAEEEQAFLAGLKSTKTRLRALVDAELSCVHADAEGLMQMGQRWLDEAVDSIQAEVGLGREEVLRSKALRSLLSSLLDRRLRDAAAKCLFEAWAIQGWLDDLPGPGASFEEKLDGSLGHEDTEIDDEQRVHQAREHLARQRREPES